VRRVRGARTGAHARCRFLPYVGYVTIAMVRLLGSWCNLWCLLMFYAQNDFPQLKFALLGGLGLLALVQRE
jgi:signal peptidase